MDEYRQRHQARRRAESAKAQAKPASPAPPTAPEFHVGIRVILAAFALGIVASMGSGAIVLVVVCLYLCRTVPSDDSFPEFFKSWFLDSFYPRNARAYREAKWGGQQTDPVSSLIGSVKSWVHEKTETLQGAVVYEVIKANTTPRFMVLPIAKIAFVPLAGLAPSEDNQHSGGAELQFIGFADRWFPNPLQNIEFR